MPINTEKSLVVTHIRKTSGWRSPQFLGLFAAILVFFISYNLDFPESYDRYRYIQRYEWAINDPTFFWNYFLTGDQKDFLFYLLMFFGCRIGIEANFFLSALNALTVLLIIKTFSSLNNQRYGGLFLVIAAISCINISLFSGVRFYLALAFFSQFLLNYTQGKYKYAAAYLLIASLTHFSFLIFFLSFFPYISKKYLTLLFASATLGIFASLKLIDVYYLVNLSSELAGYDALSYVSDAYREKQGETHRNIFFYILNFWIIFPIIFFIKKLKDNKSFPVLILSICTAFIFTSNFLVFGRYFLVLLLTFLFSIGLCGKRKYYPLFLWIAALSVSMRFILDIHDNRDVYLSLIP